MAGNTPHENVLGHKNSENHRIIHYYDWRLCYNSLDTVRRIYCTLILFCRMNFANSIKGINPYQKKSLLRHLEEVIEKLEGEGRTDEI